MSRLWQKTWLPLQPTPLHHGPTRVWLDALDWSRTLLTRCFSRCSLSYDPTLLRSPAAPCTRSVGWNVRERARERWGERQTEWERNTLFGCYVLVPCGGNGWIYSCVPGCCVCFHPSSPPTDLLQGEWWMWMDRSFLTSVTTAHNTKLQSILPGVSLGIWINCISRASPRTVTRNSEKEALREERDWIVSTCVQCLDNWGAESMGVAALLLMHQLYILLFRLNFKQK